MTETEALILGNKLLRENGLYNWSISINRRNKRKLGSCKFKDALGNEINTIEISSWLFKHFPDRVNNTVRHEVAHALAGYEAGHGPYWKKMARRIGARPIARAYDISQKDIPYIWETVCSSCDIVTKKTFRRRSFKTLENRICKKCGDSNFEQRKIE